MAQYEPIERQGDLGTSGIPDKLYFRIGEVARLCEVPAYVLRFWESEFPQLKPNKGGTGQRLYRRKDVEMALRIKSLLYDQGYTIPGARQVFKVELRHKAPQLALGIEAVGPGETQQLRKLRRELGELHAILSSPPGIGGKLPQPIRGRRSTIPSSASQSSVVRKELSRQEPMSDDQLFDSLRQPGPATEGPDGGSDATHG